MLKIVKHWACIPTVSAVVFLGLYLYITVFKLAYGLFNALDLAIFNQVIWNTVHGDLFAFTIHPQNYLGDHAEFTLLLLSPIYALAQHPATLLVIQGIAVASTVFPLIRLFRYHYNGANRWVGEVLIAIFWALNPFLLAGSLFEFHMFALGAPLLAWTHVFYREKRYGWFWVWAILLILTREEFALTLGAFALLAILEMRQAKWWLPTGLVGGVWFMFATWLISVVSPLDSYKFAYYYSWMGESLPEVIRFMLTHPKQVLHHVLGPNTFHVTLLTSFSTLFLSWIRPGALLLGLPIFLIHALNDSGLQPTFIHLHYHLLFTTSAFLAMSEGLPVLMNALPKWHTHLRLPTWAYTRLLPLAVACVSLTTLFTLSLFSPVTEPARAFLDVYRLPQHTPDVRQKLLSFIQPGDRVLSSGHFLEAVSGRAHVYSMHYHFLGVQQFSRTPFPEPELDVAIIDTDGILRMHGVRRLNTWAKDYIPSGPKRLRELLEKQGLRPAYIHDAHVVFTKSGGEGPLYTLQTPPEGAEQAFDAFLQACGEDLCLDTTLNLGPGHEPAAFQFHVWDGEDRVWSADYQPGYGFISPEELDEPTRVLTHFRLILPVLAEGTYTATVEWHDANGVTLMSKLGSVLYVRDVDSEAHETVTLGDVTVGEDGVLDVEPRP